MNRKLTAILFSLASIGMSAQPQGEVPFGGFGGFGGFGSFDGEMPDFSQFGGGMWGEMPEGPTGHVDMESTDLPLIQINTDDARITKQSKITAQMKITDNGPGKRNTPGDAPNGYDGYIGIKIRGNSSASFTQKRYTIETRDAEGHERKAALLGMPAGTDWVLLGPFNDRSMMRDAMACELWNQMGHWASRTRYAELMLNGEYRGVYLVMEKIKRGPERVNISKWDRDAMASAQKLAGGYILRIDAADADDVTFRSTIDGVGNTPDMGGFGGGFGGFMGMGGFPGAPMDNGADANAGSTLKRPVTWSVFYPKKKDMVPQQLQWLEEYIARAEGAIDAGKGYERYIDVESFVDYFIHTELSLNADGFKRSAYFYLDASAHGRDALLHAGPVWDYNLAYGNCNFCSAGDVNAWVYEGCETNPTPAMWKSLAHNKAFMSKVRKRYAQLRQGILSHQALCEYIDRQARLLDEAQQRHYTKYPTLLKDGKVPGAEQKQETSNGFGGFGGFGAFGGMGGGETAWFDAYTPASYQEEIQTLKDWLAQRLEVLDHAWLKK